MSGAAVSSYTEDGTSLASAVGSSEKMEAGGRAIGQEIAAVVRLVVCQVSCQVVCTALTAMYAAVRLVLCAMCYVCCARAYLLRPAPVDVAGRENGGEGLGALAAAAQGQAADAVSEGGRR